MKTLITFGLGALAMYLLDREQGIPHLKGVPCRVTPCADPR